MSDDAPKPILIPMPVLPTSGTSAPQKKTATKKRAAKKRVARKKTSGGIEAEIRAIAASQGKIQAIKAYRTHTGAGLREAKDAVEAILG